MTLPQLDNPRRASSSAPNGDVENGHVNIFDESNDTPVCKVKYSNGTIESGTVALS